MNHKDQMTAAEYIDWLAKREKTNKYNAKRTVHDGVSYASRLEVRRVGELNILLKAKEIIVWSRQPVFKLGDNVDLYRGDFLVIDKHGDIWVEDTKGVETDIFKRTKRNWPVFGPYPLHVMKRKRGKWITKIIEGVSNDG